MADGIAGIAASSQGAVRVPLDTAAAARTRAPAGAEGGTAEVPKAGFGKESLSTYGAALRAIRTTLREARKIVPTQEELREAQRAQREEEEAQAARKEEASRQREEQGIGAPTPVRRDARAAEPQPPHTQAQSTPETRAFTAQPEPPQVLELISTRENAALPAVVHGAMTADRLNLLA